MSPVANYIVAEKKEDVCNGVGLPAWFKQPLADEFSLSQLRLLKKTGQETVCLQARCPNLNSCFKNRQLTFMILGGSCTRNCLFCAVPKANGVKLEVDLAEPQRISRLVEDLGIQYAVITSVTRDDLADGGAEQFVRVIEEINPGVLVEILIPDFMGQENSIRKAAESRAAVIAHNLETVKRLSRMLRPQADYRRSLNVLRSVKHYNPGTITKSSLMLGLGETREEVIEALADLRRAGCGILALGQYLAPSPAHYPVKEFIAPEQFDEYAGLAREIGFLAVASGPLVRSSYKAEELYRSIHNA